MREMKGDLFAQAGQVDFLCLTTNGDINKQDRAVMGRGVAQYARDHWAGVDFSLARQLALRGNVPSPLGYLTTVHEVQFTPHIEGPYPPRSHLTQVWSFPVKHHWDEMADMRLIAQSAKLLVWELRHFRDATIVIPKPGCGNGGLIWEVVQPLLEPIFDDRFTIIDKE